MPWTIWLASVVVATINTWTFLSALGNIFLTAMYKLFDRRIEALIREYQIMGGHIGNFPDHGFSYHDFQDDLKNFVKLTQDEIGSISQQSYGELSKETGGVTHDACPVCFEDYKSEDEVYILPKCNHIFHTHCVEKWLTRSLVCPMCRANIRTNLQDEKEDVIVKSLLTASRIESQGCA